MDWKDIPRRFFDRRSAPRRTTLPALAFEVGASFVAGARLDRSSRRIKHIGIRQLPSNALPAGPPPHQDRLAGIRNSFAELASELGGAGGPLGLLLPDGMVRVASLTFETLPSSARESDALIRWRLKDLLPYPPNEARISYEIVRNGAGPIEVVAMAARSSVLAEYESVMEPLNGQLTLLLPVTAALLPLLPPATSAELLLHISGAGLTTVMVAGDRLLLWRHEPVDAVDQLPQAATDEMVRVLASAQDRLKVEVRRAWLYAGPLSEEAWVERLRETTDLEMNDLPCPPGYAAALPPDEQDLLTPYGMPFAGLIANRGSNP